MWTHNGCEWGYIQHIKPCLINIYFSSQMVDLRSSFPWWSTLIKNFFWKTTNKRKVWRRNKERLRNTSQSEEHLLSERRIGLLSSHSIHGQNGIFYNDLLIKCAVNASNLHVIFINHFIWIYFDRIWREPGPAILCNLKKGNFFDVLVAIYWHSDQHSVLFM